MLNVILALTTIVIIFVILLMGVMAGRWYGKWQLTRNTAHELIVVEVAEAAVFALLGLLVAFTFSGAYDRFEARKVHIIDEANAIDSAYLRIDLLAPSTQPAIRESFKQYLDSRLKAYRDIPHFYAAELEYQHSVELQKQIWSQTLAACKVTNDQAITQLIVESENTMFEIANLRYAVMKVHSPIAIFVMLIILSTLSSFLAGYCTAKIKFPHLIHVFVYLIITTLIIYVIIDMELPRLGLIRVDSFDSLLDDVRLNMNSHS